MSDKLNSMSKIIGVKGLIPGEVYQILMLWFVPIHHVALIKTCSHEQVIES